MGGKKSRLKKLAKETERLSKDVLENYYVLKAQRKAEGRARKARKQLLHDQKSVAKELAKRARREARLRETIRLSEQALSEYYVNADVKDPYRIRKAEQSRRRAEAFANELHGVKIVFPVSSKGAAEGLVRRWSDTQLPVPVTSSISANQYLSENNNNSNNNSGNDVDSSKNNSSTSNSLMDNGNSANNNAINDNNANIDNNHTILTKLPRDVLFLVLSYVSVRDLQSVACVNHQLSNLLLRSSIGERLWERMCRHMWGVRFLVSVLRGGYDFSHVCCDIRTSGKMFP
jgi:hypothetical protein